MGRAATTGEGLNWLTLSIIVLFHVGALAALFLFSWQRLVVMAVLYVLAINVGIGMCYHRLLTHRGYHVPKWVEYVMSIFATTSLEGGPIFWVSTHRVHHQLSDQEGDPHTPREGGWWAHAGWILFGAALHAQTAVFDIAGPQRDRFHVWLSEYHWLPITVSGLLLFAGGWLWGGWVNGVAMVLWGVLLRVTRTWCGPMPGFVRSMTTAPAKPRPPPAITSSNSIPPAARRCCRSMAARSRPIAASPRRRCSGWRRICAAPRHARAGPQNRRCRAAIWMSRRSRP